MFLSRIAVHLSGSSTKRVISGPAGNRTRTGPCVVNVSQLRVSLTRIYDNNLVTWRNTHAGTDILDRPVATKDIKLPAQKNKTQDLRLSLDDLLPADAPRDGVYLIRLEMVANSPSNDEGEDRGYGRVARVIHGDSVRHRAHRQSTVALWWTQSGQLRCEPPSRWPMFGVRVYSNKNQFLGEATTGDTGLASITPTVRHPRRARRRASSSQIAPRRGRPQYRLHRRRINWSRPDLAGSAYQQV